MLRKKWFLFLLAGVMSILLIIFGSRILAPLGFGPWLPQIGGAIKAMDIFFVLAVLWGVIFLLFFIIRMIYMQKPLLFAAAGILSGVAMYWLYEIELSHTAPEWLDPWLKWALTFGSTGFTVLVLLLSQIEDPGLLPSEQSITRVNYAGRILSLSLTILLILLVDGFVIAIPEIVMTIIILFFVVVFFFKLDKAQVSHEVNKSPENKKKANYLNRNAK